MLANYLLKRNAANNMSSNSSGLTSKLQKNGLQQLPLNANNHINSTKTINLHKNEFSLMPNDKKQLINNVLPRKPISNTVFYSSTSSLPSFPQVSAAKTVSINNVPIKSIPLKSLKTVSIATMPIKTVPSKTLVVDSLPVPLSSIPSEHTDTLVIKLEEGNINKVDFNILESTEAKGRLENTVAEDTMPELTVKEVANEKHESELSDVEVLDEGDEVIWVEAIQQDDGVEIFVQAEYDDNSASVIKGDNVVKRNESSVRKRNVMNDSYMNAYNRMKRRGRKPRPGGHQCTKCDESFVTVAKLVSHRATVHTKRYEYLKKFPCPDCNTLESPRSFVSKRSLIRHQRAEHWNDIQYVCEQCGKSFYIRDELDRHRSLHHAPPPFICTVCDRTFNRKQDLKFHSDTHAPSPQYQCSICGTFFRTQATLRKHLQWHSGIKPHACPACPKKFFRRNVMRAHLSRHYGTQPFVCEICNARFAFRDSYQRHVRSHSSNLRHRCTICEDKQFTRPHGLKAHMLKAHNIRLESVTEIGLSDFLSTVDTDKTSNKIVDLASQIGPLLLNKNETKLCDKLTNDIGGDLEMFSDIESIMNTDQQKQVRYTKLSSLKNDAVILETTNSSELLDLGSQYDVLDWDENK